MASVKELERIAHEIQIDILKMYYRAGWGHMTPALSCVEIFTALYFGGVMRMERRFEHDHDWVIMSKGHGCATWYSCLSRTGYFPHEDLNGFYQAGSKLVGLASSGVNGVPLPTGSLGHGINLWGTQRMLDRFYALGTHTLWFSTEHIFSGRDGLAPHTEEALSCPVFAYGRHKAEIECYIRENMPEMLIYRLSQNIDVHPVGIQILSEVYERQKTERHFRSIKGQIISPTYIGDTAKWSIEGLRRHLSGIYHCANPEYMQRADFVRRFLKALGSEATVEAVPVEYFNFKEGRPLDTRMSIAKLQKAIPEMSFHSVDWVFEEFIKREQKVV